MVTTSPEYLQIGKIMKAAREFKHQSQSQVAALLNCTQGSLSKYEQGLNVLSAPLWFKFCDLMEIPYDSLVKGVIDRQIPFSGPEQVKLQRHGTEVVQDCGMRSRELYPFMKFIKETKDENFLEWCLENVGLKEFHAIDFDYSISMQTLNNLMSILQKNKLLSSKNIERPAELSVCEVYYGKAWKSFVQSTSPEELLRHYIHHQRYHQIDLDIKAENLKVTIKRKTHRLSENHEFIIYKNQCIKLLMQKFFNEPLQIEWK